MKKEEITINQQAVEQLNNTAHWVKLVTISNAKGRKSLNIASFIINGQVVSMFIVIIISDSDISMEQFNSLELAVNYYNTGKL